MLDFFRNHRRLMMIVLILFVLPGLGFVGIEGFRGFFDEGNRVAKMGNVTITGVEFESAWRNAVAQAKQIQGDQFNIAQFNTPEQRLKVLNTLLERDALVQEANRLHLFTPNEWVKAALLNNPVIASLRKSDGSFDAARYRQILAAQGFTPESYENQVRNMLTLQQIPESIAHGVFVPQSDIEKIMALISQTRIVQMMQFKPEQFLAKVKVSHQQITDYYQKNKSSFMQPASATVQYLVFSPEVLAKTIKPTQAQLLEYYKSHLTQFQTPKQVRLSHIFIAVPNNATVDAIKQAQNKAEKILQLVQKQPQNFTSLAKQYSQDKPSAERGGNLGFIAPGMIAGGPEFDQVAFSLKKGQISGVVRSSLGFHILEVTAVKPAVTKSFNQVKSTVQQDYVKAQAANLFNQGSDQFNALVYEQSKSLQPAAHQFHLSIQTADVSQDSKANLSSDPVLNHATLLSAIFSDDSVKRQYNTKAIDVGENQLVSARIVKFNPAHLLDLKQVENQIQHQLALKAALQLALQAGKAQLVKRQSNHSVLGFGKEMDLLRAQANALPVGLGEKIFQVNEKSMPAYVGADLGESGYVIYRVNRVKALPKFSKSQLQMLEEEIAQQQQNAELQAYMDSLMARSKVKYYGDLKNFTQ